MNKLLHLLIIIFLDGILTPDFYHVDLCTKPMRYQLSYPGLDQSQAWLFLPFKCWFSDPHWVRFWIKTFMCNLFVALQMIWCIKSIHCGLWPRLNDNNMYVTGGRFDRTGLFCWENNSSTYSQRNCAQKDYWT